MLKAAAACAAVVPLIATSTAVAQSQAGTPDTKTSIKHLVVIFQENVSFDHYFG